MDVTNVSGSSRVPKGFWVWALFDSYTNNLLETAQARVRARLGGPEFPPHLTLSGCSDKISQGHLRGLADLAQTCGEFDVSLSRPLFKSDEYESIFLKVAACEKLKSIAYTIDELLGTTPYEKDPHVSLYYGVAENVKKTKAIENVTSLPSKCMITAICVADVDENAKTWNILRRFKLQSSN